MIKWCMTIMAVGLALAPVSAPAQVSLVDYGWDDNPDPIILGKWNNITASLSTTQKLSTPYSLKLVDGGGATPYVYVAWITGLADGEQVTASAWIYDPNPEDEYPKGRLWAHYTSDPADINSYAGSTAEGSDYSSNGWTYLEHTWTFDVGDPARDGMVIEVRTYTDLGDTVYVDDLSVSSDGGDVLYYPGNFVPIPHVYSHVTTIMVNSNGTEIELCIEDPLNDDIIITETVANGTLYDGGSPVTAPPDHTVTGTLTYDPPINWSGLDTLWFKTKDDQVPPQSSAETVHEIAVQKGGVVISEVMLSPSSYDSTYEFIEIYNYSGATVNLGRVDAVPVVSNYDMPTTDNLLGKSIDNGQWMIIAIDPTAEYPEAAGKFRCEWGLLESDQQTYSLPDGTGTEPNRLLEVPLANWEYLWASPAGTCQAAKGARILLFDDSGDLLDALDLSLNGQAGNCYGSSYAVKQWVGWDPIANPLDVVINDNVMNWYCSDTFTLGRMTGGTSDQANPGHIPGRSDAPDYEGPCFGACCLEDGGCVDNLTVIECYDLDGYWMGPDTMCCTNAAQFVACLEASGPEVTASTACQVTSDYDGDTDVDLYDFYLYQQGICLPFCTDIAGQPPYPVQYDRTPICITGAIVCNTQDLTTSADSKSIMIQDPAGYPGRVIYGTNAEFAVANPVALDNLVLGDKIEIRAHGMLFFGTPEIVTDYDDFEVTVLSPGDAPEPTVLTVADFSEERLSTLIKVENVTFADAGGTFEIGTVPGYLITEGAKGTTYVRVSGDTNEWDGKIIPTGAQDVIGILSWYCDPYPTDCEYSIKVRYYDADIQPH